jgi:hypothetical protein
VIIPGELTSDQSGLPSPKTTQAVAELKEALTTEDEKLALAWLKKYMTPNPGGYESDVSVTVSCSGEGKDQVVFQVQQFRLSLDREALQHSLGVLGSLKGSSIDVE